MLHRLSHILFMVFLVAVCSAVFVDATVHAIPAFPGAEGFGAVSVGGRGGKVYKVTTLSGGTEVGSLKWALSQPGPKIIVFDVSGVIDIGTKYGADFSKTTIAGQTAPGAGITIKGQLVGKWASYSSDPAKMTNDVIIRFVRIRYDGPLDTQSDCIQMTSMNKAILDHVDVSWGADELMDLNACRQLTLQWCGIVEGDPRERNHHFGMMSAYRSHDISIHHNLFAHNFRRNPYVGVNLLEHINNVAYNGENGIHFYPIRKNYDNPGEPYDVNTIGNYFKDGPTYDRLNKINNKEWAAPAYGSIENADMYQKGNYFDWIAKYLGDTSKGYVDLFDNNLPLVYQKTVAYIGAAAVERSTPFNVGHAFPVTTESATDAYNSVLNQVGCLPRDWVMDRIVNEVKTGTGSWGRVDPPGNDLMYGLTPGTAPMDSDDDGMPDQWETAHGLNPNDPEDRNNIVPAGASENDRHKGYTYIEYYINDLADKLIAAAGGDTPPPVLPPASPQSLRIQN